MIALDHAVILVPDLDEAALAYQRLGFSLTARGRHSTLGTANHTLVFERDYLELMGIVEPGPANARWAGALARGPGLKTMALATADASALARTLEERGVPVTEPVHFGRPVQGPSGAAEARFTVCFPKDDDASPAIPVFFCQHHTPELVWLDRYRRHANTAVGLIGLTVVAADPEATVSAYERLLGTASVHPGPGGITLTCGSTRVRVVRPAWAGAALGQPRPDAGPLGVTIAVTSLNSAKQALSRSSVPYRGVGERSIAVEPTFTHGVFLELEEI